MKTATGMLEPWFRSLERRDRSITDEERAALEGVLVETTELAEGVDVTHAGEEPTRSTLLIAGWAARYLDLTDGRRQIIALHLPGDFIDLYSFPLHQMDHSVMTLTPCTVAYAPHERLRTLTEQQPHLTRVLWLSTLIDAAIMRQWLLSAGQRSALERLANLVCELKVRLEIASGRESRSLVIPLTQAELGQALGITPIHVNRIMQELRGLGLVTWKGWDVEILDEAGLRRLADFDSAYLHLENEPR